MTNTLKWGDTWRFKCHRCGGDGEYDHRVFVVAEADPVRRVRCTCTDGHIHITAEPKAGMLCEYHGRWQVLYPNGTSALPDELPCFTDHTGNARTLWHGMSEPAPLLPSPDQLRAAGLTAWDAFRLLCESRLTQLEVGVLVWARRDIGWPPQYSHYHDYTTADQVDARLRDLQKYTALLAYLKQFGEGEDA